MKVYWFTWGSRPDESFFKYGKQKPSDTWCMFETKLAAYRHAYKTILMDEIDKECHLPDHAPLEDYKDILHEYGWDLETGSGHCQIIEIEVWK